MSDPRDFGGPFAGGSDPGTENFTGFVGDVPASLTVTTNNTVASQIDFLIEVTDETVQGWLSTYTAGDPASDATKLLANIYVESVDSVNNPQEYAATFTYNVVLDGQTYFYVLPDLKSLSFSIPDGLALNRYRVTAWIGKTDDANLLIGRWAMVDYFMIDRAGLVPAPIPAP